MLCLDMRLVQRLRGERTEEAASRDRSKSVCVSSFRNKSPRDVSAFKLFHRRASSAISTASDLISRRGVFSRRYYGSVERLQQSESDGHEHSRRFRIENGDSPGEKDEMFGSPSTPVLENPEYQTRWYFKYFLGKLHQNYVGLDNDRVPYFLSIVLNEANNSCVPLYRAILFKKTGAQKISLPLNQNRVVVMKQIITHFPNMDRIEKGPREIYNPEIQKDLLLLEEQEGSVNFKFGVIYMKYGQSSDDEILSNEHGSERFEQFLDLLGERIRLKGWDKYRGGLDIKGDMTGKYSVYTIYEGHEIMFHVSTLLPYSRDNKQQVERKRHIGNDIVNIVFIDVEDSAHSETAHAHFNPTWIKSQFTHVFAVVSAEEENAYRLSVFSDEAVPIFGPSLPCPPVFTDSQLFRDFLLVKLINGEKATFETPTFARKRERTLDMLIRDLYTEQTQELKALINRRALSDVLSDTTARNNRVKEDARQIEFVRIGQALKLEAIVRGDAPTSLASASSTGTVFRRSPWEPNCFYPVFPDVTIHCADSWHDQKLVIATDEGVFIVEDGSTHRAIFDKTVQVKQLSVVEAHGILLLLMGNKEGKIYVFRLSQFGDNCLTLTRSDIKDHRLERARGANFYSVSKPGGAKLRMCVAIGRKIALFQWKHLAAWTTWCSNNDQDTVDGFTVLWEVSLSETPTMMTILDNAWTPNSPSAVDILVCVGYKNHWDLVNGRTGYTQHLYSVESPRPRLVTALDLYEDQEIQLVLCYNNMCHFQRINQDSRPSTEHDFHWNSVPTDIILVFPYVIAFTTETMEIRLIVNGSLIHTMSMPKMNLLAGKNDIFFVSTAPEFFPNKVDRLYLDKQQEMMQKPSPPSSPSNGNACALSTSDTASCPSTSGISSIASTSSSFSYTGNISQTSTSGNSTNASETSPEVKPWRIYRIPIHNMNKSSNPVQGSATAETAASVKAAESKLTVPQPRVSRSATTSPVPPKAKLSSSMK